MSAHTHTRIHINLLLLITLDNIHACKKFAYKVHSWFGYNCLVQGSMIMMSLET